jgi:hypothetical protein
MKNETKQEYTTNNQNPLVLLTAENGKPKDLIGHIVNYGSQKIWAPYKVGDELDFEPFHSRYPKFVTTGYGKFGSIDKELKSPSGLLFLIADGMFPMGCGVRKPNTVFAVQPKTADPMAIAAQIEADAGYDVTDVRSKASGRISLLNGVLSINGFSESWYKNQRAYLDAVAGLVNNSYEIPGKTPIIFHANVK